MEDAEKDSIRDQFYNQYYFLQRATTLFWVCREQHFEGETRNIRHE